MPGSPDLCFADEEDEEADIGALRSIGKFGLKAAAPRQRLSSPLSPRSGAFVRDRRRAVETTAGLHANRDAVVKAVHVTPGAQIEAKDALVEVG